MRRSIKAVLATGIGTAAAVTGVGVGGVGTANAVVTAEQYHSSHYAYPSQTYQQWSNAGQRAVSSYGYWNKYQCRSVGQYQVDL